MAAVDIFKKTNFRFKHRYEIGNPGSERNTIKDLTFVGVSTYQAMPCATGAPIASYHCTNNGDR